MSVTDPSSMISRSGSVLLDLTESGPAHDSQSPARGIEVFKALSAVDREALHIVAGPHTQQHEQFAKLVWSIGEKSYEGLLVVLLPASGVGERLTSRFTTISGWLMVTVEQVNQSADSFWSEFRIEHALGLADRYAENGGTSLILRV